MNIQGREPQYSGYSLIHYGILSNSSLGVMTINNKIVYTLLKVHLVTDSTSDQINISMILAKVTAFEDLIYTWRDL